MATTVKKPRVTAAQLKEENAELKEKIRWYEESAFCYLCDKHKPKDRFYKNSDPRSESGVTPICRDCATDIARRKDNYGEYHTPTKESVMAALYYIDKPFLVSVWDASYFELQDQTRKNKKKDIWASYIKNISMINYETLRWQDSDHLKNNPIKIDMDTDLPHSLIKEEEPEKTALDTEILENYQLNKAYAIRQIGYDPFSNYPNEEDKPMLYATLVNFMDDETKNDGMKMRAVIQIVKAFNQIEKLNDKIDEMVNDPISLVDKAAVITKLTETVDKFVRSSSTLAKDNGIAVNHNNNKSKGSHTLTGKIKKLSEIGFRNAEINTFDIETCNGMQQVAELSEAARHKQIGYDENIAQEIKDIKVQLVESLTKERDSAVETMRRLLVENIDLKNYMKEKGLMDANGNVIV